MHYVIDTPQHRGVCVIYLAIYAFGGSLGAYAAFVCTFGGSWRSDSLNCNIQVFRKKYHVEVLVLATSWTAAEPMWVTVEKVRTVSLHPSESA